MSGYVRHGSNARDSASLPARSSPVILSEAKDLCVRRARPFASLRVTGISSTYLREPGDFGRCMRA
jgi:hypothetical protein